jgi:tetratricopeptide (TPR) repeat protein
MKNIIFWLVLLASAPLLADGDHHVTGIGQEKLGTTNFAVSCSPAAQLDFNRAVAMLHSFWYDEAKKTFAHIAELDSDCVMAHWGVAMSLYRQLWATPPTLAELQEGREALTRAQALPVKTDRERLYLDAAAQLYRSEDADYGRRKQSYTQAMAMVQAQFPDDPEANVFYALALISTTDPHDKSYEQSKKALTLLQKVLNQIPDHPGVAHYIIHASDNPDLATQGLAAARAYAHIAPAVPHALHMPSHIFIRLGLWEDAAASNLAAYLAAKDYAKDNFPGKVWDQELHFMDYLLYAYLQDGQNDKAQALWKEVAKIKKTHPENSTSAYALAAIPARYFVERRAWTEAAKLSVAPQDFPWGKFGWCEAITQFARGLGAARSGDIQEAQRSEARLGVLRDGAKADNNAYAADQIEIQRLAVAAWIAQAYHREQEAEALLRKAADLEDVTEKDNVTPGPILPAREMLGDLLLELHRWQDAADAYRLSLQKSPKRLYGLQGLRLAEQQLQAQSN